MLNYVNSWFAATLFTGLVFRPNDVIWPIRLLYYILPFKYLFNGLAWSLFHGTTYSGAQLCPTGDASLDALYCPAGNPGFYCPAVYEGTLPPQACWGRTGDQILKQGAVLYEVLDGDGYAEVIAIDFAALFAQAVVYKLGATAMLYLKSMAHARAISPEMRSDKRARVAVKA